MEVDHASNLAYFAADDISTSPQSSSSSNTSDFIKLPRPKFDKIAHANEIIVEHNRNIDNCLRSRQSFRAALEMAVGHISDRNVVNNIEQLLLDESLFELPEMRIQPFSVKNEDLNINAKRKLVKVRAFFSLLFSIASIYYSVL